ncbi:MAG: SH3 domain-containing protein [Acidimicrobiales bacterium]
MNDHHDPTEDLIRRALQARAEETTVTPDALESIRRRNATPRWIRPATYGAVAAALALIAGFAYLSGDDDATDVDPATTTTLDVTTSTVPGETSTTTVPDTTTSSPEGPEGAGAVIWPLDGPGETSAEAAARGWVENVLEVAPARLEAGPANPSTASFILSKVGEDGAFVSGLVTITVVSPDGGDHWFVERAETPDLRVELVERNGEADGLRVSGLGNAFEGTGLLWIDDEGPTIVSLGNIESDHFSVVVPWDGDAPVRVRLETGRAMDDEVPSIHAFAVDPADPVTDVRVTRVADDDVLNVRTAPGVANAVAFTLPPDATGLAHTGGTDVVDGETWWEIVGPDGAKTGWANARYLTVWRAVEPDSALAAAMEQLAHDFLTALGSDQATLDPTVPRPHPAGTQIGGIGVFADAPTPFTTIDDLYDDTVHDWNPFPDDDPCDDLCLLPVGEFLGVRARDAADAQFTIGPDAASLDMLQYFTGHEQDYYDHHMTVVAYVPPTSEIELDWRRYTFAFDLVDGTPTISAVWVWGWTP